MPTPTDAPPHAYRTARGFFMTSAVWMIVATFMGLTGATELIAPDLTKNIAWLVFGRVRPIHVNLVLFGFVTPALLGAAFYYVPRLLRAPLYSEPLGVATVAAWNLSLVLTVVTLSLGYSQGREYAEMVWIVDVLVVGAFLLVFLNLILTVRNRTEPILYVSVWYVCAGVILTAATFSLGNVIWQPDTGALAGIPDAILLWFYGHNVFGLLLTPLAAGVAYCRLSRAKSRLSAEPVQSGKWSALLPVLPSRVSAIRRVSFIGGLFRRSSGASFPKSALRWFRRTR